MTETESFDDIQTFPNDLAKRRFDGLIGIDETRDQLVKIASLWLDPEALNTWEMKFYKTSLPIVNWFKNLPHLVVLAGDVGTGKSTLAETFGDRLARTLNKPFTLYRLSITARGSGAVGEMTARLSKAFGEIKEIAQRRISGAEITGGLIFLIDEADSIVQSRELGQMHHEDRAGVNTVIRGIDDLNSLNLPVVVVLCTNRMNAIDPAVKRRSSKTFFFSRPNEIQRKAAIKQSLEGLGFNDEQIGKLADATGPNNGREYGFTYSDLTQQLLPAIIVQAVPDKKIEFTDAVKVASELAPTPPFIDQQETIGKDSK